jgi:ornithine cyclodeaminase/alanine dehydrogenase
VNARREHRERPVESRALEPILYLTRADVRGLMPGFAEQVDLVAATYRSMAAGRVELPPKPGVHPRQDAFIHAMPAYLADSDVAAIKWVSGYPSNKALGLPYITGLMIVNDAATGLPLAIMDAAEITAARTAAASGACIRQLAPDGWRRAAIIGCGEQGRYHAELIAALHPDADLHVYDPDPDRMASMPVAVTPHRSIREAVEDAEVIVTLAPIVQPPAPSLERAWLGDRFLALPADFNATFRADVTADADAVLADDVGQWRYYQGQGQFGGWPVPASSVGEVLDDPPVAGRIVACCLGVGALDAAFAHAVLQAARAAGVGLALPT